MSTAFEFADTPKPPYYVVVFTNTKTHSQAGYGEMAERMESLARDQPGFLGIESAGDARAAITLSYWSSLEDIRAWRAHLEHLEAQSKGRELWYSGYRLRVALVEREVSFPAGG